MAKHHLLDRDGKSARAVADDLLGLHATSNVTPYLSLFNRIEQFSPDDLTKEIYGTNGLVRVRAMRGTFFIVTRRLRSVIEAATQFSRKKINKSLAHAGISSSEFQRLSRLILTSLSKDPKTLPELKKDLTNTPLRTLDWRRGLRLTRRTNLGVVVHLLLLERRVQSRPEAVSWWDIDWDGYGARTFTRITKVRYELVPPLASAPVGLEEARAKLAALYVKQYGPVSIDDVAWWMDESRPAAEKLLDGFSESVKRVRIQDSSEEFLVHQDDIEALQNAVEDETVTRFLPYEDPYSKGFKLKDRIISPSTSRLVYPTGNAMPTVVLGEKIIGTWNIVGDEKKPRLNVKKLTSVPRGSDEHISKEGRKLADFMFGEDEGEISFIA